MLEPTDEVGVDTCWPEWEDDFDETEEDWEDLMQEDESEEDDVCYFLKRFAAKKDIYKAPVVQTPDLDAGVFHKPRSNLEGGE